MKELAGSLSYTLFKWSLMISALAWGIIHRLSQSAGNLPEFVYVNF